MSLKNPSNWAPEKRWSLSGLQFSTPPGIVQKRYVLFDGKTGPKIPQIQESWPRCRIYLREIKSYSRFPQSWFLMKQWPSRWKFPLLAAIPCKKSPSLLLPLESQALSTGERPWSHLDLMVTWVLGTIPSMQQFPRFFTTFPVLLPSCSPWSFF